MARYLFTDAVLNINGVGIDQVVEQVHALSQGGRAVRAADIARIMHLQEVTVVAMLQKAERLEMVRRVDGRAWLPITT